MVATYTEFCCRSGGNNLYAGTLDGSSSEASTTPLVTYTGGTWVQSTRVFTVASGNPVSDGVAVGHFVSVYPDGSSAPAVYIGRVTARDATTITISSSANAGSAPTDGTNTRTLVVGGAWQGPNGTSGFPITLGLLNATNVAGNIVRVNYKNDQTGSVTAAITAANSTTIPVNQGYTTSYGDGGKFTLDGGTSGSSYVLLTLGASSATNVWRDFIFQNNGASGTSAGISNAGASVGFERCVINSFRGHGITNSGGLYMIECEVYGCNQSNTGSTAGVNTTSSLCMDYCMIHDNTGSNTLGVRQSSGRAVIMHSVLESNGLHGLLLATPQGSVVDACDFYNNGGDGININGVGGHIRNCNFIKNGTTGTGLGITGTAGSACLVQNCGFGSGTMANDDGDTTGDGLEVTGSVTYAANTTPWNDPANGDFRINLATAKNAGRGAYTQTAPSYAGSRAYPDIGSNEHLDNSNFIGNVILPPNQIRFR